MGKKALTLRSTIIMTYKEEAQSNTYINYCLAYHVANTRQFCSPLPQGNIYIVEKFLYKSHIPQGSLEHSVRELSQPGNKKFQRNYKNNSKNNFHLYPHRSYLKVNCYVHEAINRKE